MALLGDRYIAVGGDDISFFMNVTSVRGGIVIHDSSGSGAALDQSGATVAVPTGQAPSTLAPAGLLLCDVVNYDLTKQHLNEQRDEVQKNSKVWVLRHGWVVTDQVTGNPTAGNTAFFNNTGILTPTDPGNGPKVGRFLSSKDANGFAKVEINITG